MGSKPRITPDKTVLVIVKSTNRGVAVTVLVGVDVAVAVAVLVGVEVTVGVSVTGVAVAVIVGVDVTVGVGVMVGVAVAVGVVVDVLVGAGVTPTTVVSTVTVLFASFCSTAIPSGSTVAVLLTTRSVGVVMRPVIVIVATALGPMPKAPRSQSSMPPMTPPVSEQIPRVVVKPVYWKLASGSSMTRTDAAGAEPMFLAWMV